MRVVAVQLDSVWEDPDTNMRTVERLLAASGADLPVTVQDEPALGQGQAYLKTGMTEMRIDLDGVIDTITRAVTAFFQIEAEKD